ncbi:MAG: Stf0 family sulfotransferase [Roseinatronobacter sp.]
MDIVLCATQRCGSTLVVEDMRNSGVLGQPEEWFIPWDPAKTDHNWKEAFDSIEKRASSENGVSAVKVMANQLFRIEGCLESFVTPAQTGPFPHFRAAFGSSVWVWLRREDVVYQAISRLMAQQTGINHATARKEDPHFAGNLARGYDSAYNQGTQYRYGGLLRQVTAITLENLAWKQFFSAHGIEPLELIYEDVIKDDTMRHLDRISAAIGQSEAPPRQPRRMVKLANARNDEWHGRFYRDAAEHRFQPPKPAQAG